MGRPKPPGKLDECGRLPMAYRQDEPPQKKRREAATLKCAFEKTPKIDPEGVVRSGDGRRGLPRDAC
jgi:hypothetical protein